MIIFSPWRSQYGNRSATRAIVPSSFMISQITPEGLRPARRERSTAASVWPVRSSTPPGLALSGKTWPGCTRSRGEASGSIATWIVLRPVGGRDPGGDSLGRLDRDGERRLEGRLVLGRHQVEPELVAALGGQREADQPAAVLGHEVDRLGGGELGGHRQIALVLAVLVVADDDHAPRADVVERLLDRRERRAGAAARVAVDLDRRLALGCVLAHPFTSCLEASQKSLDVPRDRIDLDVELVSAPSPRRGSCAPASRGSARPRARRRRARRR